MKKALSLLLALVLCLSLCACGGGNSTSAEKAIVGEWKALDGDTTTFKEGGTGIAASGLAFSWEYDTETEYYMLLVSYQGWSYSSKCKIETENNIRFISIEGEIFYHADDYEKAVEANK